MSHTKQSNMNIPSDFEDNLSHFRIKFHLDEAKGQLNSNAHNFVSQGKFGSIQKSYEHI
jgi:hypothetical protein